MKVFIDHLNLIRIESDQYIHHIHLDGHQISFKESKGFFQYFHTLNPIEMHISDHIYVNHQKYPLQIGLVTLSNAFDQTYRYDGPLGAIYQKDQTTFHLFTPVAKEVYVVIEDIHYPMIYQKPIWTLSVPGDHEGKSYYYYVRLVDAFKRVKDPYAMAAALEDNIIIDWQKTEPMIKSPVKVKNHVDAVIYEGHIRDMSIHLDVDSKGVFEGVIEESKYLRSSVLNYIKNLGMTHLQLLPVYDFEGVDDENKTKLYNWGYNPSQYFCVEGWLSKNPKDPYDRINGLKKVINYAHQIKLGVNMDVVYNHVYNHHTFAYDDLVPGYFYRHDVNYLMTNASYCGNDVETRRYMVRRLIVDSLVHFTKHFHMDGFRFDLMGLLDLETMHQIEKALKSINPYIMLYGEGWQMHSEVPAKQRSHMGNHESFKNYAHFNDFYRNTMKGELHGSGLGYAMGNKSLTIKAMQAIIGSPDMFLSPNQSINYVECHDNLTFYDKMLLTCGFQNPDFKYAQDFANHLIAISQGVPFYHAGQEFYRSKKGVENSYNSPDEINRIHWNIHQESIKKLKKLLKLRKKYKLYRLTSYDDQLVKIEKDQTFIIYTLEDETMKIKHFIKNNYGLEKLPLDGGKLIFPSQYAIEEDTHVYVDQPGIYIVFFKK